MVTLKEVLEIPSYSGMEDRVVNFIIDFCDKHGLKWEVDDYNNVYVTKGKIKKGEFYPCVVAHTDTVHFDQKDMILNNEKIKIIEKPFEGKTKLMGWCESTDSPTGIGGDDKVGVYICLNMLLEFDTIKAAFFVEEEIGMRGSKQADPDFFKNVGYAIQFDGPTRNWFSKTLMGKNLWNEEFLTDVKPLLENYNVDNFSIDPFTDVLQLVQKFGFCCSVFPTGYYNQHSKYEYVIPEETEECYQLGKEALNVLGLRKYTFNNN
jgi:hypothetical protein